MKLRVEIPEDAPDEIVIRAARVTDEVQRMQALICSALCGRTELALTYGELEYYVSCDDILFFETSDGRVTAHTKDKMYYAPHTLHELTRLLPRAFLRVSKSCVLNTAQVTAISRGLTGIGEAYFKDSYKKVYISRMYYKAFRELIEETMIRR